MKDEYIHIYIYIYYVFIGFSIGIILRPLEKSFIGSMSFSSTNNIDYL